MLEPYDGKPSRTVLRGGSGSNAALLPDTGGAISYSAPPDGPVPIDDSIILDMTVAFALYGQCPSPLI